jgi:hypothetical protein
MELVDKNINYFFSTKTFILFFRFLTRKLVINPIKSTILVDIF